MTQVMNRIKDEKFHPLYVNTFWRESCGRRGLCACAKFKRPPRHAPKMAIDSPTTVGSKSTKTALGTCFPAPVSLKKVLKESSPPPMVLSEGIWPSGWIPCSRQ